MSLRKAISMAELGQLPDSVIRFGIRRLLTGRLRREEARYAGGEGEAFERLLHELRASPIAVSTSDANRQHYEVPADFFRQVLGARMKYSSCLWPRKETTLDESEKEMLALTCERAALRDGMRILELGCGWGSLTLWMAEHYPSSRITAVSNSASQRRFIEECCRERGLDNVVVLTVDMNDFDPGAAFDRVVSVEMFEHMRNVGELMRRIRGWLAPEGRLFVHIFCHRKFTYLFRTEDDADWMGRYFFTGGMMPSEDLLVRVQDSLKLDESWRVNGVHYARTLLAWLARMDARRETVLPVMAQVYGAEDALRWFGRWRLFFLSCAELFAWNHGKDWFVAHYRFRIQDSGADFPLPA